jgi:7,8-dihydropterin-6-yl-methyl-4-(beta-D-ribofuranosyl)aminobenzene 5'-phosphate synthase
MSDDIGITGPIPRITTFEDTGGAFFLDLEARKPDPIVDDLAMWFSTAKGLVVVTGCCHSGLVNTIRYIQSLTEGIPLHSVVGGLHLVNASPARLSATCDFLQTCPLNSIIPYHCTGDGAVVSFEKLYGQKCIRGKVGDTF